MNDQLGVYLILREDKVNKISATNIFNLHLQIEKKIGYSIFSTSIPFSIKKLKKLEFVIFNFDGMYYISDVIDYDGKKDKFITSKFSQNDCPSPYKNVPERTWLKITNTRKINNINNLNSYTMLNKKLKYNNLLDYLRNTKRKQRLYITV